MECFICIFLNIIFVIATVKSYISYNTFPYNIKRATEYSPRVIDKTCLLKPDHGPCRAGIQMHYFVPTNLSCGLFTWGGCQGNGNRFDTADDCLNTCLSRRNMPNIRPVWCKLAFDYGFCFGAVERWYYDPLWKVCKKTIYSGCGGNKNNFYFKANCEAMCRDGIGISTKDPSKIGGGWTELIIDPKNLTTRINRGQANQFETTPCRTRQRVFNISTTNFYVNNSIN